MKMIFERLIPGMKHRGNAHRCAEAPLAKLKEGLTDGFKEKREQNPFVGEDQAVENVRQGKDHMEIAHRQKLGGLLLKPLGLGQGLAFGAVAVTAGGLGGGCKGARVALLWMYSPFFAAGGGNGPPYPFFFSQAPMGGLVSFPLVCDKISPL